MAIIGLGTDIVEIARFEGDQSRTEKLARRVLTDNEYQRFLSHPHAHRYLAKRFAAKEAAVKALGSGIGNGVGWQQLEIQTLQSGAPTLLYEGEFARRCEALNVTSALLSIADEMHYAIATVMLQSDS
ncbi:holo-ACP synthase [Aestuariibacter salexigens]|uniref:holo-ACP synthase n=1 Tax=Aestuariibacter salexigens TaxID=226010 RepID=UPI0004275C10|nr:holo-ACP synthase [Aestuariibacter salexigens]